MDAELKSGFQRLESNLQELLKNYRLVLDLLRQEKEVLLSADISKLAKVNSDKDSLLTKIRSLDSARERYTKEIGQLMQLPNPTPRLLELAMALKGAEGEALRQLHSALEMVFTRVQSLNKENADYTESALRNLNGALTNIKDTLAGKNTYERKGQMNYGPEKAGNFVSREA